MSTQLAISILVGFLSGILCRSFVTYGWAVFVFVLLVAAVFSVGWVLAKRSVYLAAAVLFVAFALGSGRVILAPSSLPDSFLERVEQQVELVGVVASDPDVRERTQRVTVATEGTKILAVAPRYPEVLLGEQVLVRGTLVRPQPFDSDGGRVFRYDRYLAKDGVFALVEEAEIEVVGPRDTLLAHARGSLADLKHLFMEGIERALPEPHASLASGLLLGGKQGLGTHLLDAFTIVGLVHIIVLSGYNITIVADTVVRAARRVPKRYGYVIAALVVGAFVLAAGAGSAAVRAGLMALVALFARATGRTYAALRALGFAVLLMLVYNPLLLAFDPGFQLSIVATLGLILGAPIFERWLASVHPAFLRDVLATTLAAQVAVLPLLLYQTGNLSLISLLANALVLPVVPLAMGLSFVSGVGALVTPIFGGLIGVPAYLLLSYVIGVTEVLASLPFAHVIIPAFPFVLVLLSYGALYFLWKRLTPPPQASSSPARSS